MFTAKYVIIDGDAIVFFEGIAHSDMVRYNQKCEGAGFVTFLPYKNSWGEERVKAHCYGESISLKIASRLREDSDIVTRQICRG